MDTKGSLSGKLSWERRRAGGMARNPLTSTCHSLTNARKTQVCKGLWIWLTDTPPHPGDHKDIRTRIGSVGFFFHFLSQTWSQFVPDRCSPIHTPTQHSLRGALPASHQIPLPFNLQTAISKLTAGQAGAE